MPKVKIYRFTVEPAMNLPFPVDMLRYDRCWPATTEDAVAMSNAQRRARPTTARVTLVSGEPPTEGRWRSFGWTVAGVLAVR